ncbi:hypothetical protein K7X08_031918 [Anisodus acutangulus]|uniref:FRIGIDA-like protein n=1 Tax=Anisodus acutangulus TaxID=402998 RepID=A0A9Q1RN66_9SOLA|nr:hypothetical protein K7X08_031918 [Anisodus acutangulus]
MINHCLKSYMVTHLSDKKRLLEQVPRALKLSENPAKLVLNCLDKFYLQGSSTYIEGSHMIPQRNASILALECLLLMIVESECVVEIAKREKKDAKEAALAWKGKLVSEGGLGAKGISGALRRSSLFMENILEVIEWSLKSNAAEAVDIAYTFGLILPNFFPGGNIDVKTTSLEKEIVELNEHVGQEELAELIKHIRDQKMSQKRKIDETESSGCFSNKEMKNSYFPNPCPQRQQKAVNHSNSTLLEGGGMASHIYGYSLSPSVLHAPVAGSIHENVVGSLPGPVRGVVAMGGGGAGKSLQGGSCAGVHGLTLVDSTPGQIGSHTSQLYGRRGDTVVYDRLASHSYAYKQSSYLEGSGSTGLPNTVISDAYRPPSYLEASIGLSNTKPGDAYRPLPYLEASMGLPDTIPADAYRPPPYLEASMGVKTPYLLMLIGLHHTWKPLQATELYRSGGSRAVDAVPSAVPAHSSSYLYWSRQFCLVKHYFLP